MSIVSILGVQLNAMVTAVPSTKLDNLNDKNITPEQGEKVLKSTGIRYRHLAKDITASDLCYEAACDMFTQLDISKSDVEILIFVSQTPDFILPATAPILQHRLELDSHVAAFDINMGCSGYVYGLSIIASFLSNSQNSQCTCIIVSGRYHF